jgi:hypothetical protein
VGFTDLAFLHASKEQHRQCRQIVTIAAAAAARCCGPRLRRATVMEKVMEKVSLFKISCSCVGGLGGPVGPGSKSLATPSRT